MLGNGGNTTLSAPFAVSDDQTTVSCPATPASLAPGESLTCTAAYGVSQADLDAGSVTNTASATALDVDGRTVTSDEDAETVAASQAIVLTLDKRVPAGASYERVGDVIDYDYVLGNGGNTTLSAPFAVSDDKTTVSCPATPASLAPGESLTCTAAYGVSQADLDAGSVTNTASATALDVDGRTVTSDEDAETVAASQAIVLTLDKRVPAGASYERVGDVIDYDYVLGNGGNTTLSAPFAVSDDKTTVSCPATPASLAPGESLTCTAAYGVSQADLDAGSVTNTASATALDVDGRTVTSDEDAETVAASQAIVLTLDKRVPAGASYERVGDVIDYDYVLGNGGNTTLSAPFAVSDDKTTVSCPATPASLAPGESLTCTAAYGVSQADLDAGSVTNTASATALDVDGRTVTSDEDAETVAASQQPDLTVVLAVVGDEGVKYPGDVIRYRIVATNTGNTTLTDLNVTAKLVGTATLDSFECDVPMPAASLLPGDSITCRATHKVTLADARAGSVIIVACAVEMPVTPSAIGPSYVPEECDSVSTDVGVSGAGGGPEQQPATDMLPGDPSATSGPFGLQPIWILIALLTSGALLAGAWGARIRRGRHRPH